MSRKNASFIRGVLENSSLGEVAYYVRKAKTSIDYAEYTLQNAELKGTEELLKPLQDKMAVLETALIEAKVEFDALTEKMISKVADAEETEEAKSEGGD